MSKGLNNLISGDAADLRRIRDVRKLLSASSDRETVRRMAIFCRELLRHQKRGDVVLCAKGKPDKVAWIL